MKNLLSILLAFFLSACGVKLSLPKEPTMSEESFKDLNLTYDWYKAYDNAKLNEFLNFVLLNNSDINIARSTLLTALARADLIDYDFYPTLSANLGLSGDKNLNSGAQSKKFSNGLNLSYELDIYGKIRDSSSASEFSAKASAYDLENLKISMINTALNNVFELAYFNDVDNLLKEYLANLEQMRELYAYKFELGKIEELDLLNIEQNLLKARQDLLRNEQNRNLLIKNLQDLIGKQEGFAYIDYFKALTLSDFKNLNPNFNIPLEALVYRPDVRSKLNTLKSAFKDYTSVQKSIFPSISLGGALNGSDKQFDDSFKFEVLSGNIKISLPFLDYGRVKQNIKISQFDYESALVNYEQSLQSAMNEFALNYKDYQSNTMLLQILKDTSFKQELITQAYWEKYNLGKSELKDYLDASNTLNSAKQSLLGARFNLLKTINSYYQITALNYDERNLEMP
ncbi:TolC family protein [Campylobacter coli]|uniref:TolC family protein n=1 Tax=Campylobacter coli TaxID=195 RepID=UPI001066FAA4|nr:TolC family protein [Campylobacter coli]